MIGSVRVSNWKRHGSFEHTFHPGLNFILGANGRGKTSLLQAIRFGLFGVDDTKETREAIRFDATSASAQVELLGDESFTVGRSIDTRGRIVESLNVAGATTAHELLLSHFGADPAFLRSLVFLSEGDIYAPGAGNVGLEQQLESLLPISGLSRLIGEVRGARGPLSKGQRSQRSALQLSRDEIAQLVIDEVRLLSELEQLRVREAELQDEYLVAADRARDREQWIKRHAERAAWQRQVSDFAAEAGLTFLHNGFDQTLLELDSRREALEDKLRSLTQRRGELAGSIAAIRSFLVNLNQAGEHTCPLCRQSLDADHRKIAMAQHASELDALIVQHDELEAALAEGHSEFERAREAIGVARRLSAIRPPAGSGDEPPQEADAQLAGTRGAVEELRTQRALVERELLGVREHLATSEASRRLEEQVTGAFRDDALLEVAGNGTRTFLADVRRSVMAPIAEQLSQQWKAYRPDAEWSLALDDAGAICLARDEVTRPYSVLSGGEKTVATVLLRVALLTALTTSDVIILDEPLEHLDPRARRIMISSLHHAVRKGLLSQILISTYEESLVRRLLTHSDVHAVWLD